VVLATVGRPTLDACLRSLAECRPQPAEIIIVDQSPNGVNSAVLAVLGNRAWYVRSEIQNARHARNLGLHLATQATVLFTDDDCTVAPSWAGVGSRLETSGPPVALTGRVLGVGPRGSVPSIIELTEPEEYSDELRHAALWGNNMVVPRTHAIALGGFDPRLPSAGDNDFSYRWLRAGYRVRYDPDLIVWHHGWRTRRQLRTLYRRYAYGQGFFYAKHLLAGDHRVLRLAATDMRTSVRAWARRALRGRPDWPDEREALLAGVPLGLLVGLRKLRRVAKSGSCSERTGTSGDPASDPS